MTEQEQEEEEDMLGFSLEAKGVYSPGYSLGAILAARESQLLVRDSELKSFGGILVNIAPREVSRPKTLAAWY